MTDDLIRRGDAIAKIKERASGKSSSGLVLTVDAAIDALAALPRSSSQRSKERVMSSLKLYRTTKGNMERIMCDITYPHPVYFDRPSERLTKHHLKLMLHERAEEAKRIIDMMERMAEANVENARLRDYVNALHDFHNAFGFFTAEAPGRPHLWEV